MEFLNCQMNLVRVSKGAFNYNLNNRGFDSGEPKFVNRRFKFTRWDIHELVNWLFPFIRSAILLEMVGAAQMSKIGGSV